MTTIHNNLQASREMELILFSEDKQCMCFAGTEEQAERGTAPRKDGRSVGESTAIRSTAPSGSGN
jgi:hypothetical protein